MPSLMRQIHGPGHQATTAALITMVNSPAIAAIRPMLAAQVRFAADAHVTPSWGLLFGDLADWNSPSVRERWTQLYFGRRSVPRHHPDSHSQKALIP